MAAPNGLIVGWPTAAAIPAGWSRVTAMDSRFPKGATTAASTGGAFAHTHDEGAAGHQHTLAHDHNLSLGAGGSQSTITTASGAIDRSVDGSHSDHSIVDADSASPTAAAVSPAPTTSSSSFSINQYTVRWIQSDGTTDIPVDAVMWWPTSGGAPTDHALMDGTGGQPDLRGYFLVGAAAAANGGTATAASSHNHSMAHAHNIASHSHTRTTPTGAHTDVSTGFKGSTGGDSTVALSHVHSVPTIPNDTGTTASTSPSAASGTPEPPYYKLHHIKKTGVTSSIPTRVIAVWNGSSGTIPAGWISCDGNNGSPNLNGAGRYIKGATGDGQLGDTGGASTHTHAFSSGHTHTDGNHNHGGSLTSGGNTPTLSLTELASLGAWAEVHSHPIAIGNAVGTTTSVAAATTTATNNDPPYYTVLFIQILSQVITDTESYSLTMSETEAVTFAISDTDTWTVTMTELEAVGALGLSIDTPTEDEIITEAQPTVTWTLSDTQQSYQVYITSDEAGTNIVYDSGQVFDATSMLTLPAGALQTDNDYYVWVYATATNGLDALAGPVHITTDFGTSVDVTGLRVVALGGDCGDTGLPGFLISWDQVIPADTETFLSYDVYRREAGDENYMRVAQILTSTSYVYYDYNVKSDRVYQYAVVWQALTAGGTLISRFQSPTIEGRLSFSYAFFHDVSNTDDWIRLPAFSVQSTINQAKGVLRSWGRRSPTVLVSEELNETLSISTLDQLRRSNEWGHFLAMVGRQGSGSIFCLRVGIDRTLHFVRVLSAGRSSSDQKQWTASISLQETFYDEEV